MENIATVINEFDNAWKEHWGTQAPSNFFDYLLMARDIGYEEGKQEWKTIGDKREAALLEKLKQLNTGLQDKKEYDPKNHQRSYPFI